MELVLYDFFPDRLNLYGDRGNVIALQKRCEWRGIQLRVEDIKSTNSLNLSDVDILFMGGGSDREQSLITDELLKIKTEFKSCVEDGVGCLAICGGYQLIGNYYMNASGEKYSGMEICDFYTKAASNDRMVGNIMIQSNHFGTLVGFENHSGITYHSGTPLGTVINGFGNNGKDGTEGILYKNLIGTYLHGPLLPKNPILADCIIAAALERKYGKKELIEIDDSYEYETHCYLKDICLTK